MAQKTHKVLSQGISLILVYCQLIHNFHLFILVLEMKMNKHLGKHPLASLQTRLCPFPVPGPLAAGCRWSLEGGDGVRVGISALQLAFLISSSAAPLLAAVSSGHLQLCHHLCSHPAQMIPLGWPSLSPYLFLAWSVGWWWWSVCVTLLFLRIVFFLINLSEGACRSEHHVNVLGGLQLMPLQSFVWAGQPDVWSTESRTVLSRFQCAFKQYICNVLQQRALIKQQAVLHKAGSQPGTLAEVAQGGHVWGVEGFRFNSDALPPCLWYHCHQTVWWLCLNTGI